MKIIADLHTHTIASEHAYSTIHENTLYAAKTGIKYLGMTDHGPEMLGAPSEYYFGNLSVLPDYINGVRILRGIEANIRNDGSVDLPDTRLKMLDFAAAGIHPENGYTNSSCDENTNAIIKVIENKYIKMITHPDNPRFPVDYKKIAEAAFQNNVIIELNAGSYDKFKKGKRGVTEESVKMIKEIAKTGGYISLNSDAHFYTLIGDIEELIKIIEIADFPEELIINTEKNEEKFKKFFNII